MKHPQRASALWLLLILSVAACSNRLQTPEPRSIIVYSGERIQANGARMGQIEQWLTPELDRINLDPAFLIRIAAVQEGGYPWDTLEIVADTVDLTLLAAAADVEAAYLVYGYLRLMDEWGTLEEVLPEAEGQSGYGAERAILKRVAEVWLLGRSVFDTQPFGPLDELVYSNESGYLDEFIFATQGDRFSDAAVAYRAANPGREGEFRSWFRRTFQSEGPQYIRRSEEDPASDGPDGNQDSTL